MRIAFFLSLALVASSIVACGGTATESPTSAANSATDGGPATVSTTPTNDAGTPPKTSDVDASVEACTAPDPTTAPVATMALVAKSEPAPEGGAVVDGSYELTSVTVYTGPGGMAAPLEADVRWTLEVASGVVAQGFVCTSGCSSPGPARAARATYTISGTTIRSAEICPGSRVHVQSYTATKDSIVLYERNDKSQVVTYKFDKK